MFRIYSTIRSVNFWNRIWNRMVEIESTFYLDCKIWNWKKIIQHVLISNMRKRRIRCSKAFLDFTRDTLRLVGDRSATMAATSVFPLPRCIVSSSSRFRAPRRKLQNTNICSSCRPDILMRLRPTYATILCFKQPPTLFWHTSDFFLGQLFFISLSTFF